MIKDYCNAARLAGKYNEIEPMLKKSLEVPKKHDVGFYILDPLQELTVHLAYTAKKYSEAVKYGQMFMDTLKKYNALNIHNRDFEYSRTIDAKIVELELGHSYLSLKNLDSAALYLRSAETSFLSPKDPEKLSRVYKHLAVLAGYRTEPDSMILNLNKFDFYSAKQKRAQAVVLFTLPKLTRNLHILDDAYQQSQQKVERLTRQNYIIIGLFILAVILVSFVFWMQQKSKRGQARINQLLLRDFERSQELNEEKTKYFSILSHELRTPIFAITGLAKLLQHPVNNTKENIEAIINSGNHLLHLVNNVLQHNKLEETGQVSLDEVDFELNQAISEVLQTTSYLAGQKDIDVVFHNQLQGLRYVKGDKQKLAQILVNLISNAIRYSKRNGQIEVLVSSGKPDGINGDFHFSVKDNGAGIEASQLPFLFDYRKTTYDFGSENQDNLKGMGIGLFVVANFIKSMGSEIKVETRPGNGSRFYFDLVLKLAGEVPDTVHPLGKNNKDVNILVVDDIKINLIVTQKALKTLGVKCVTATDADPVVEIIRNENVDLVLMDLNMPIIDGYALSKKIRQAGINIPIIAHTAVIKENIDYEALQKAEIVDYLIKPYPIEELKEKLTRYLDIEF